MYSDLMQESMTAEDLGWTAKALRAIAQHLRDTGQSFEEDLREEEFSLTDVLNSVTGAIMEQYPRITLSRDVFPQVVMRGVRPFVEGAFENLLLNAVEAQKYVGQVSVSCTQVRGGRSGKSLDVFICDNGPGVKLDVRDKVKEGQQITTKGAGRGLGLVIARLSVLECHGELELLPIPLPGWRGACFRVSLPVQRRRQRT